MPFARLGLGPNNVRKPLGGGGTAPLGLPTSFTMAVTPSDVENLAGGWVKETNVFLVAYWQYGFYYKTNNGRLSESDNYGMYGYINNNWEFRGYDADQGELYSNTAALSQAPTNQTSVPRTQTLFHGTGDRTMTNS
jgi:hypothetical protein